jgi:all-trans-8'-apo-beta-carotenal 15,15'-oxygenase
MKRFSFYTLFLLYLSNYDTVFSFVLPNFYCHKISNMRSIALFSASVNEKVSTFDQYSWEEGYSNCDKEVCEELAVSVPSDINGTYYRNGGAKYVVGKDLVTHPFDGDGMITALTCHNGKALFRNRFVQTSGFKKESKYRRILERGFGTQIPGGFFANFLQINFKNVANTNAIYWYGRLLALWEGGLPHLIEPDSLRTVGKYVFKGSVGKDATVTAHPRYDANTDRLIFFSSIRGQKTTVSVHEYDRNMDIVQSR